jgi:hypothetical protein
MPISSQWNDDEFKVFLDYGELKKYLLWQEQL